MIIGPSDVFTHSLQLITFCRVRTSPQYLPEPSGHFGGGKSSIDLEVCVI